MQEVEDRQVQEVEDRQVQEVEDRQVQEVEDRHVQQVEDRQVQEVEDRQVQEVEDRQVQEVEDRQVQEVEDRQVQEVEDRQVQEVEDRQVQEVEDRQVQEVEDRQVQEVEDRQVQEVEDRQVQEVEDRQVQEVEDRQVQEVEDRQVQEDEDEQALEVVVGKSTVTISQLGQDLKLLELLFENRCTPQNTSSIESARDGLENVVKDCYETSKTQREQSSDLENSSNCILKLNFALEEDHRADDGSLLETTDRDLQAAQLISNELQEDENLQVFPRIFVNPLVLEIMQAIRSLLEEIVKLMPQVVIAERTKAVGELNVLELVKELQTSILVIQAVQEEKTNWAAQNEALLKEKDMATRERRDWEAATSMLLEQLHEGEHALTDAVREMEGILDDSLSQPTALDRVGERERFNFNQFDTTTPEKTKQKDAVPARQEGGNDQVNKIERSFAVFTTMLSWFSETLTVECAAKDTLMAQIDRGEEELGNKDCLISSLQSQLERATLSLFEKDSLVFKLPHEAQDRDREHLLKAEAQAVAAVNVQASLLDEIEKHRLELGTTLKRMEGTELELAQVQGGLTGLQVELISSERKMEELAMEKEQFASAFSCDKEILERSCTVAATLVWWLQTKMAANEEAQKLNNEETTFQVSERGSMVMNLQDEIIEKTMLLKDHMETKEILINQNQELIQEINNTRNEIAAKDSLLGVIQTTVLRLQKELSASEDQSLHLAMEKEKLQVQMSESAEISKALEGVLSRVQRNLQETEAKVVELAIVQAGLLIVQEEWGLEKEALERDATEAKQRCTQLEQELDLARNMSQKFEIELLEAKAQETVLREERDAAVKNFQEEQKSTYIHAAAFNDEVSKILSCLVSIYE